MDNNQSYLLKVLDSSQSSYKIDKVGDSNRPTQEGKSYNFDGADDLVDTGTDIIGTKAVTITGWIKPYSWGEGLATLSGFLISNGKYYIGFNGTIGKLRFSSNGSTLIDSINYSISLNKWQFVSVTREVDGTANIYIGDLNTAPALSGSADQNSGTPVAGTTNVIIGNVISETRSFDGEMFDIRVYKGILDMNQITEAYNHGQPETEDPTIDLLVQYKMDEDSGTTAYDSSGNGYDGNIENTNGFNWDTTTDLLSGWNFEDDWFDVGGGSDVNPTTFLTISNGGIRIDVMTVGQKYWAILTGSTSAEWTDSISTTGTPNYSGQLTGSFDKNYIFTAISIPFYLRNFGAGVTNYTHLELKEVPFFNTQGVYSWQNEYGYSEEGSVLIPRDESNITQSVLGNDLNYTDRVKYNAVPVNSYTGTVWNDTNFEFNDNTDWNYMTYEGTATADLNINTDSITFLDMNNSGTIYNIKIYDEDDTLLTWMPVAEGTGRTLFDVTGNKNHGYINFGSYTDYTTDLMQDWNFEDGWSTVGTVSDYNSDSFITDGAGGMGSPEDLINVNNNYLIFFDRDTNAAACNFSNYDTNIVYFVGDSDVSGNIIKALNDRVYIQNTATGDTNINIIRIFEIPDSNSDVFWNTQTQNTFHYNLEKGFYQDGAATFNATTSKIDTGADWIGTKTVTVMGWIKPYGYGETAGRIIDNSQYVFSIYTGDNKFFLSSNGGNTTPLSLANAIQFYEWNFVAGTREADGTVNLYIGDLDTAPALTGSADQNSGTLEAGTTNVIIGNNDKQTRTFDGEIRQLKIVEDILTISEIEQEWAYSNWDENLLADYSLIEDSEDISGNYNNGTDTSVTYIPQKIPTENEQVFDAWLERTLTNPSGNYHNNAETELAFPLAPALIQADDQNTWFTYNTILNYYTQKDMNYYELNLLDYSYLSINNTIENQLKDLIFLDSNFANTKYLTDDISKDVDISSYAYLHTTTYSENQDDDANTALDFNGTQEYVYLDVNNIINTISLWVKANSQDQCLFSINDSNYTITLNSNTLTTNLNTYTFYIDGANETTISDSDWHYIAISNLNLYINDIYLGKCDTDYFDGSINKLDLYTTNLSSSEINYIYNN